MATRSKKQRANDKRLGRMAKARAKAARGGSRKRKGAKRSSGSRKKLHGAALAAHNARLKRKGAHYGKGRKKAAKKGGAKRKSAKRGDSSKYATKAELRAVDQKHTNFAKFVVKDLAHIHRETGISRGPGLGSGAAMRQLGSGR